MKNLMDISAMLKLKEKGMSNRAIAKTLGVDKKQLINIGINISQILRN